jgi:itaconyl-CoA hydratase
MRRAHRCESRQNWFDPAAVYEGEQFVSDETVADQAETGQSVVEQRGLFFEEFAVGTRYLHRPGRTITEGDNSLFTTLTMNTQALHLDAAWAATQPFGQRLVNSMYTLSSMVGASVAQLTQGTLVANLGFTEVSFPAPVFIGDTLYFETTIDEKRLSLSREGQGIVSMTHRALNQDHVLVATTGRSALMWCLGARP